jgi:hypothetical protein
MIQGYREYFHNLTADHDETLRRGLIAEKAQLPEDDHASSCIELGDLGSDSSDSETGDEEDPHMTKGPSYAP